MKGENIMRKIMTILFIAAVFVSLFASFSHAQDVYIDNVVIVLDGSGSMDSSMSDAKGNRVQKMAAAKTALYEVLKQIPDTTQVGLVVFSARGVRTDWVYPLAKKDDAKLKAAIKPISPGGNTPLGKYIKIGADRLLKEREKQYGYGTYKLLVVTDGEAGDQGKVDRYAPEVVARGITLDVIGVKMAREHSLKRFAHSYRAANDPESLKKAIQEVFAEVSASTGTSDVGEDAFAELAAIPNEVAVAMINAFATTGNHPVGEKPRPKVAKTPVQPTTSTTPGQQPTQPLTQPQEEFPCVLVLIIAVMIAAVVFVTISKILSG